jgi:hypothetical protein
MNNMLELNKEWMKENNIIVHDYGHGILLLENFMPKNMLEDLTNHLESSTESSWRAEFLRTCMTKYNDLQTDKQNVLCSHEDIIHAIATKKITDIDGFFGTDWVYQRDYDRTLKITHYDNREALVNRWVNLFHVIDPKNQNNIEIDNIESIARMTTGRVLTEHVDAAPNGLLIYATVFYINEDYEGGELYFPDVDVIVKPKAGSLCIFEGLKPLLHGVKTVTKGIRYSSTIFVWDTTKDDAWRRLHR